MTRFKSAVLAIPLALAAGACSSSFEDRYQAALPVDQRLPIEVKSEVALLNVATDSKGKLSPQARQQVAGFFSAYRADGSGAIEIQTAVGGRAAAQTEGEIRDIAAIYGVPSSYITVAGYAPEAGARTTTRLAYARYVASVPGCQNKDWSQNMAMTWDNSTYPTFGCSIQENTAAMAANPRDLIEARPTDTATASAERRDTIIGKYEKGDPTASGRTAGDSGKIADVTSGTQQN
jgi:pilus assembly protein CpaD